MAAPADSPSVLIRRATPADHAGLSTLLGEYFAEQNIRVRDSAERLEQELLATTLGFYLACDSTTALLGCVLGHPLPGAGTNAAEGKRLFVRSGARGQGVADRLLSHLESEAGGSGFGWLYLDSLVTFAAALRLYARRNYQPCDRYPGSDPQATHFFRKALHAQTL